MAIRTQEQNEAQYRYNKKFLKRIPLDVKKDFYEDVLLPACENAHEPVNTFIKKAIQDRIDRINGVAQTQTD